MATYLNKALVVAENLHYEYVSGRPSSDLYNGGSQFGCLDDAFEDGAVKEDFPLGLSSSLLGGAGVWRAKFGGTVLYDNWRAARSMEVKEVSCVENGREISVTVFSVDGRGPYLQMFWMEMVDRSMEMGIQGAYDWAMHLRATPDEAWSFSRLTSYQDIYDYVATRINESGLIQFQPWIARDVERCIQLLHLPTEGYASMHIWRGDKLIMEAASDVRTFWRSKGYAEGMEVPSNYVPFWHYVESSWGGCELEKDKGATSVREKSPIYVYIAMNDPEMVRQEVDSLPRASNSASVVNSCHDTAQFVFAPLSKETRFHLKNGGNDDDCHSVYERNIAALADLFVLAIGQTSLLGIIIPIGTCCVIVSRNAFCV
ncbi:hypothetical protein ACHAW6_005816 [Cyclotella cf. meneghiniana]